MRRSRHHCRALTALRFAGAMLADSKDVHLLLVEGGPRLADPRLDADNACRALFYELLDADFDMHACCGTMKKLDRGQTCPLPGVSRSSMKALSALTSADEIITF